MSPSLSPSSPPTLSPAPSLLGLALQRSPRRSKPNLPPPASRLHRSASVPKICLHPAPPLPRPPPPPPPNGAVVFKSGVKHHAFPSDAPYPLSYHKDILSADALDHNTFKILAHSCSCLDFSQNPPPKRCLDLGCGPGAWVLDAAAQWPHSEFVGFDLVNLQVPPHQFGPGLAHRIKWVHGNFLRRLPFEDGYFDHVHIGHIARGVPEDKWHTVIAEVVRVLRVGGSVEIFEEDIIFPVLPRSFTATPGQRERRRSAIRRPLPTSRQSLLATQHVSPSSLPAHDHAVLEKLFYRVFQRRFINLQPTALLMGTLDIHLHHAAGSPLINFPLPPPPAPAPAPAPPQSTTADHESDSRSTTPRMPDTRHTEVSDSRLLTPVQEKRDPDEDGQASSAPSSSRRSTPATSVSELEDPMEGPVAFYSDSGLASVSSAKGTEPFRFLPEERLLDTAGTLGLNFRRSWQGVMACREAIWDEYRSAAQRQDPLLDQLEWEEHELKLPDRCKFDTLMDRYESDMEARSTVTAALVSDLQWTVPRPDPKDRDKDKDKEAKKKAEVEARTDALRLERSGIGAVPEATRVCRKGRIFVGWKGSVVGAE